MQSRVFSVGNGVLWGEADAGIAATQAIVDVGYGPKALALLRAGLTPDAIVKAILDSDPDPGYAGQAWPKAGRQFAVMDAKGNYAAYTGPQATTWAGNKGGKFCTAQGNILAGEAVVSNMVKAFEETAGPLSLRLRRGARRRPGRRRRHARPAVGGARHRQEELRRLAAQRHRAAPAGRRQPGADQGAAPAGREVRSSGEGARARAARLCRRQRRDRSEFVVCSLWFVAQLHLFLLFFFFGSVFKSFA